MLARLWMRVIIYRVATELMDVHSATVHGFLSNQVLGSRFGQVLVLVGLDRG